MGICLGDLCNVVSLFVCEIFRGVLSTSMSRHCVVVGGPCRSGNLEFIGVFVACVKSVARWMAGWGPCQLGGNYRVWNCYPCRLYVDGSRRRVE